MNYPDLFCSPYPDFKGIGSEPDKELYEEAKNPVRIVSHKGKRDEHSSFPKGMPPVELVKE